LSRARLDLDSPNYASLIAEMTSDSHYTWLYWLRWVLANIFPRMASHLDPPDLYFPSSWDYRYVLSCLTQAPSLNIGFR
jgi:hypothetical protein